MAVNVLAFVDENEGFSMRLKGEYVSIIDIKIAAVLMGRAYSTRLTILVRKTDGDMMATAG